MKSKKPTIPPVRPTLKVDQRKTLRNIRMTFASCGVQYLDDPRCWAPNCVGGKEAPKDWNKWVIDYWKYDDKTHRKTVLCSSEYYHDEKFTSEVHRDLQVALSTICEAQNLCVGLPQDQRPR